MASVLKVAPDPFSNNFLYVVWPEHTSLLTIKCFINKVNYKSSICLLNLQILVAIQRNMLATPVFKKPACYGCISSSDSCSVFHVFRTTD